MRFKYKCLLQFIFSHLPKGEILNYLFQNYVTRALPVSNEHFICKVQIAYDQYLKFKQYNSINEFSQRYYEFGAGWDLITPISMGLLEFEVTCIDLRKLIFNKLIIDSIAKFKNNAENIQFPIDLGDFNHKKYPLNYLKDKFNFTYSAPLDARNTKLSSNYFDFAGSTATFEHIPKQDLYLILLETYRILKEGGILTLIIDYRDHWAYFDKSISIYNFLIYSDCEWKKFNPSLHYQNRLRHKDYINIISKTEFKVMEEIKELPTETEIERLKILNINDKYKNYSLNELGIKGSQIVLKK